MSVLEDELDVLKGIFFKELTECAESNGVYVLTVHLFPETGEVEEDQFVYLDVRFSVDSREYPHCRPSVVFLKWRGLADSHLSVIRQEVEDKISSLVGAEMFYDLITCVRENLTTFNKPHEDCAICQQNFKDGCEDEAIKTECFHYFHRSCISRWILFVKREREHLKKEAESNKVILRDDEMPQYECPVCRELLTQYQEWFSEDTCGMKESTEQVKVHITKEMRQWQKKMAALKKRQADKGGIIDIEREKGLLLIDPNWVSR